MSFRSTHLFIHITGFFLLSMGPIAPLLLEYQYWESITQLFEMKFARTPPIEVWEAIKDKPSLADKCASICANYAFAKQG